MVLHLQQKHSILTTTYLKEVLEYRFKLAAKPLSKYVSLSEASDMLGKPYSKLHSEIIHSSKFHGVKIGDEIYVHPDCLVSKMKYKFKRIIQKEVTTDA